MRSKLWNVFEGLSDCTAGRARRAPRTWSAGSWSREVARYHLHLRLAGYRAQGSKVGRHLPEGDWESVRDHEAGMRGTWGMQCVRRRTAEDRVKGRSES